MQTKYKYFYASQEETNLNFSALLVQVHKKSILWVKKRILYDKSSLSVVLKKIITNKSNCLVDTVKVVVKIANHKTQKSPQNMFFTAIFLFI